MFSRHMYGSCKFSVLIFDHVTVLVFVLRPLRVPKTVDRDVFERPGRREWLTLVTLIEVAVISIGTSAPSLYVSGYVTCHKWPVKC